MFWTRIDAVAFSLFLSNILNFHETFNYKNILLDRYKRAFEASSDKSKQRYYDRAKVICKCLRESEVAEKNNPNVGFGDSQVCEEGFIEYKCDRCDHVIFPIGGSEGICENCGRHWIWRKK